MNNRFAHLAPRITRHFKQQMEDKGFDPRLVIDAWKNPDEVYPSGKRHPGQWRVVGHGIVIVIRPEEHEAVWITTYLDGVVTPVRPDQLLTPEGRRFAEKGRGA